MEVVVKVDASERYVHALATPGAFVAWKIVVMGKVVHTTVAKGRGGITLASWVTEMAALATEDGGILRSKEVQAALLVAQYQLEYA